MSTSYHPQKDKQIEMVHQILEGGLRNYIPIDYIDSTSHPPLFEFSYNSSIHYHIQGLYIPRQLAKEVY